MGFISGEELAVTLAPVAVYWLYSGIYEALGSVRALDRYRLHSRRDEESNNMASKKEVVKGVLLQQAIQVAISLAVLKVCRLTTLDVQLASFWLLSDLCLEPPAVDGKYYCVYP